MGEKSNQVGRGFQPDSDVHITLEDQQKINHFARYYAKHGDLLTDLKAKQNELKNLEDASEEIALVDESEEIPFLQGEVFLCLNLEETNEALEKEKHKIQADISELEGISEELKAVLDDLKTQLYAKFGNHINLED